jgi:hypothetical protein
MQRKNNNDLNGPCDLIPVAVKDRKGKEKYLTILKSAVVWGLSHDARSWALQLEAEGLDMIQAQAAFIFRNMK